MILPRKTRPSPRREEGVIIILVAVFLLFVVGAMAALSIDVVTLYTARSEAQLAADGAALAAARVLANSGMTSLADATLATNAQAMATAMAKQVAQTNSVGGRSLAAAEVTVSFPNAGAPGFQNNPRVTVQVRRIDLPTFFARIWGWTQQSLSATATAEAYNPSGLSGLALTSSPPVATACVKPWVLPNLDPTGSTPVDTIFDANGNIKNPSLVGWTDPNPTFFARCGFACNGSQTAVKWEYFPGTLASFPAPTSALPSCLGGAPFNDYQKSVAGCVQKTISCTDSVDLDVSSHLGRNSETATAVNCLTHSSPSAFGNGDSVSVTPYINPGQPFQFVAGTSNPIPGASGQNIEVSDSLVTVPVYDSSGGAHSGTVNLVGFVQLFLNSNGIGTPASGPTAGHIKTTVVNLIGCGNPGSGATMGTPVIGNGSSAVAVRLVSQ